MLCLPETTYAVYELIVFTDADAAHEYNAIKFATYFIKPFQARLKALPARYYEISREYIPFQSSGDYEYEKENYDSFESKGYNLIMYRRFNGGDSIEIIRSNVSNVF